MHSPGRQPRAQGWGQAHSLQTGWHTQPGPAACLAHTAAVQPVPLLCRGQRCFSLWRATLQVRLARKSLHFPISKCASSARPTQSPPKPIYNRAANCTSNPGRNKGNEQAEHVHVCNSASHGSLTANRALLSKKWRAKSRPVLEGSHYPQASMQRTVSTPSSAHLSFAFTGTFIQPPS